MKHSLRLAAILMSATLIAGCGGAKPEPTEPAKAVKPAKTAYDARCEQLAADFAKQVKAQQYLPTTLNVRGWTGDGAKAGTTLKEAEYAALLNAGGPRINLMMARGGLGKSKLGWALEAQTCGKRATIRVDLHWDIAANLSQFPKGSNPLLLVVEKRLTGVNTSDPKLGVEKALAGRDLLLLFDSLDEVTLDERARLVDHVQTAMAPIRGSTAIVFTRPPVFSANYGFAQVDARLEIPMLDCDATQRALRELIKDDAKLANFLEFAKKYALDRMVIKGGGRCYYPHMATYRDIVVMRQIATSRAEAAPTDDGSLASRSRVYEFFLAAAVIKDLSGLSMMPKDLLQLVDRMVIAQNPDGSKRNLGFTIGACLAHTGKADPALSKQICERLMQSTLFKETSRPDTWQFTNQSIGDLFLARWTNTAIANKDGTSNCAVIGERAALFESNEVAGFLVGMEHGQACLLPIVQQLCGKSGDVNTSFELLDQGLPPGNARVELLKSAIDAGGEALADKTCLGAIVGLLKKTVPAASFPTEQPAAKDTSKGKGKRGKKSKKRKK